VLKVFKGRRDVLEQQLVASVFAGDTRTVKALHDKLAAKGMLTLIEPENQAPVEPKSLRRSDEAPT